MNELQAVLHASNAARRVFRGRAAEDLQGPLKSSKNMQWLSIDDFSDSACL